MRGAYKVPGGKLVAVDVDTAEEGGESRLSGVRLSGDFFLEPDEALADIEAALIGVATGSTIEELTKIVAGALGPETTMIGFSAEAVAIAVRRALGHASSWEDLTFDVLYGAPETPHLHLALDQVLTESLASGERGPTLRIWEWERRTVVIGSFQSLRNEVDPDGAARLGATVARRISGGGAMYMDPGDTITYSLYVPGSLVEGLSFERSYAFLDDWVIGALRELGIEASYVPLNDITSPLGKIGGAAQKRLAGGAVLHHVTMAYDIDAEKMTQVLRIGREKLSDKGTASANKRVDPLRSQTGMTREKVIEALLSSFSRRYSTRPGEITATERARAETLAREKFATREWLERVP